MMQSGGEFNSPLRGCCNTGQLDVERRPPINLRLEPDGAAVGLDKVLADGQPKACSRRLGGEVGGEELRLNLVGNALAVILNR